MTKIKIKKNEKLRDAEREYALECALLDVSANLEQIVFGAGNNSAEVMFVGEAPGANEAAEGIPFVGKAGKLLDELLDAVKLAKSEIYTTNAVKYRPITPGKNSNRTPTKKEVIHGQRLLELEIEQVDPKIIVTLGNTPLFAVSNDSRIRIGDVHGRR